MARGENTAKETLYDEAEAMAAKLSDGHASDAEFGKALAFMIRAFKPLYLANLVTEEDLKDELEKYRADCPIHSEYLKTGKTHKTFFHVPNIPTALTLLGSLYGVIKLLIYFVDKT